MRKLGRPGLGAAILCTGIVVGAVSFSGRREVALGAQGAQGEARPAALLLVEPPRAGSPAAASVRNDLLLIRTRRILEQALVDRLVARLACLKGRTDAASWLAGHLQVENPEGTSLIRVSLVPAAGATTEEQAALINAVARAFVDQDNEQERRGLERRHEQLESDLDERRRHRSQVEHELDSLMRKTEGKLAESVPREVLASYAMDMRRKRLEIDVELAGAKAVVARRKERTPITPADAEDFARLIERVSSLEAQGTILDQEKKQIEVALGQSSVSNNLSVTRLVDALRHDDAAVERLNERRGDLAMERGGDRPRIQIVDPAVAR
jgi:hypothetical protein